MIKGKVTNYKDLLFWQTAFGTTKQILILLREIPHDKATQIVHSQIVRSAGSIGANIAEGYGRYKGKEYERFIRIALGSANETEYWLLILSELHPAQKEKFAKIIKLNSETIAMLVATLNKLSKD